MLQELYEYAVKNQLAAQPGFKPKRIKAYVCLGRYGEFLGIDPGPPEPVICPDMGSAAQGPAKCNVLVEKRNIPLSGERPLKRVFFLEALEDGAESVPQMAVLRAVLDREETVSAINEGLDLQKIKPGDAIGFKVDGVPLESLAGDWWPRFRKAQSGGDKQKTAARRCLISGELGTPIATAAKVPGLIAVGGHSSGDAVICFDKDAFCSYGLKQAENACVSEDAMAAVNAALTRLIQKAPVLAGAKWIHWYKEALPPEGADLLAQAFGTETEEGGEKDDVQPDGALEAAVAEAEATRLVKSYRDGERIRLSDNIYYLMPVSGAGGRIMVRGWQQGSYEDLQKAMNDWWEDLSLVYRDGKSLLKPPPIGKINYRLLKPQKGGKSLNTRMEKELAGLEPRLIFAIVNRQPLPDAVASKALQYIRSKMLDSGDDVKREPIPDPLCCQIVKAWLNRKNRFHKGGTAMQSKCNPDCPETAYQCGRMMAVYAAIQTRAMGKNLGAGVIQRYYTSASTSPALVFGRLSQLAQHHLTKIESKGAVVFYEKLLAEISEKIGRQVPTTLTLQQQAEFALGYYQQRAAMFEKKTDDETTEEE